MSTVSLGKPLAEWLAQHNSQLIFCSSVNFSHLAGFVAAPPRTTLANFLSVSSLVSETAQ